MHHGCFVALRTVLLVRKQWGGHADAAAPTAVPVGMYPYSILCSGSNSGHSSAAWLTKLAQHVRVSPYVAGLDACRLCLPLQLLQGELDSLKAERGKAQRKTLEVG